MKNFLLVSLISFSLSTFAQSYFVLDNGITITVDQKGYVYDFGHYTPLARVTLKGGQYLIEDANVLVTVDEKGNLYRKYELIPQSVIGKGMNYLIGEDGTIVTIDSQGSASLVERDERLKSSSKYGGTYFAVGEEIFVVAASGEYSAVRTEGLKASDILTFGGNYFMTNRGLLYTVSQDGKIIPRTQDRIGIIVKKGGNYFVDSTGSLYTVAKDGSLKLPALPISLRVQAISRLGANYFMDGAGKLFTVDSEGNVFERWLNYDLKMTRIISL